MKLLEEKENRRQKERNEKITENQQERKETITEHEVKIQIKKLYKNQR